MSVRLSSSSSVGTGFINECIWFCENCLLGNRARLQIVLWWRSSIKSHREQGLGDVVKSWFHSFTMHCSMQTCMQVHFHATSGCPECQCADGRCIVSRPGIKLSSDAIAFLYRNLRQSPFASKNNAYTILLTVRLQCTTCGLSSFSSDPYFIVLWIWF